MPNGALPVPPLCGPTAATYAYIADGIAGKGWVVIDDFLPPEWAAELLSEQQWQSRNGAFRSAGIGRNDGYQLDRTTRGDEILWLNPDNALPAQRQYLGELEELRQVLNRELFLGLNGLDSHAAHYPPGSFYRRHLDAFRHDNLRVLTVVLYLNRRWHGNNGGGLRLFLDADPDGDFVEVLPEAGRLVVFMSARFHHEVLETHRLRSSITSWFLRRPLA